MSEKLNLEETSFMDDPLAKESMKEILQLSSRDLTLGMPNPRRFCDTGVTNDPGNEFSKPRGFGVEIF